MLAADKVSTLFQSAQSVSLLRPLVETPIAAILRDNPVAWYRMLDDPAATQLLDRGPNLLPLTGAVIGGASVRGALLGDTDNAHQWDDPVGLQTASSAVFAPFINGAAIECWALRAVGSLVATDVRMVQGGANVALLFGTSVSFATSSGLLAQDSNTYDDGFWHHFVGMLRKDSDGGAIAELYVDGVLRTSSTGAWPTGSGTGFVHFTPSGITVDELVLYTHPLTPERIALHARTALWVTERLYKSRLRGGLNVQFSTPTETGGIVDQQQVSMVLANGDGYWNQWREKEVRGKIVHVHMFDEYTQEIMQYMFTGEITAWTYALDQVEVVVESISGQRYLSAIPALLVTSGISATSQANGQPVSVGMGAADSLPSLLIKTRASFSDPEIYDYLFCRGNFGITTLYRNGVGVGERTDWQLLPRTYRVGGVWCTVVRFTRAQGVPITAAGQRAYPDVDTYVMYEWKWLIDFRDDIHNVKAKTPDETTDELTTAALTVGPTGIGLGGVNLIGNYGDFLVTDTDITIPRDPFTIELWINPKAAADQIGTNPTIFTGPNSPSVVGLADVPSWEIVYEGGTQLTWKTRTGVNTAVAEVSVPVTVGEWNHIAFVRTKSGATQAYKNGVMMASVLSSPLLYGDTPLGFRFFEKCGDGRASRFVGLFGYCRISATERDAAYIRKSFRFMRRNFVEFLRELIEVDLKDQVDDVSFNQAADAVNDIPTPGAGQLNCDGWITTPSDARTIILALSRLRDFRLLRAKNCAIGIELLKPGAIRQLALCSGPPENNILSVDRLVRFSLTEAINKMPIVYRQRRDANGQLQGYAAVTIGEVLPVGRIGDPYELPFVWSHRTADIIRDFTAKRFQMRDDAVQFIANHEARYLRVGHVARLKLMSLVNFDSDVEVVTASLLGDRNQLTCVHYDESPFTYEPADKLPPETTAFDVVLPAKRPFMAMNGSLSEFIYHVKSNQAFTWDILIGEVETLLPAGEFWDYYTSLPEWTEVPSSGDKHAAITKPYDSHYLELHAGITGDSANLFFTDTDTPKKYIANVAAVCYEVLVSCPDPQLIDVSPTSHFQNVQIWSRPTALSGGADGSPKFQACQVTRLPSSGPFTNKTMLAIDRKMQTGLTDPNRLDRWSWDGAKGAEVGVYAFAHARVDYVVKRIYPHIEAHQYLGNVRIWRSESPVFPDPDTIPYKSIPQQLYGIADGGGFNDDDGNLLADRWWYYFVRVYDVIGREIGKQGPIAVYVEHFISPPEIVDLDPGVALQTDPDATVTVSGMNFVDGASVVFDSVTQATTFVSSTALTFVVHQSALAIRGYHVQVQNPDGQFSNVESFLVAAGGA